MCVKRRLQQCRVSSWPIGGSVSAFCSVQHRKSVVVFLPVRLMAEFWSGMSEAGSLSGCGLRSLAKGVSELLNRFAEEVLGLLEARGGRTLGRLLRLLLSQRLAAATGRIVRLLERELEENRRQLEQQRRLLEALLSPVVRLGRAGER